MNRICSLFGIQYPIIQAGMVWCSGWRLASAVSNAGGLGLIGAGSMHPEVLREHIRKCEAVDRQAFWRECPADVPGNRYLDADIGGGKSEDRIYLRRQPENMDKVFEGSWHDGRSRGKQL